MNIKIDIDKDEAVRPLSVRERVAIHILLVIMRFLMPARYDHQFNSALGPIFDLINPKP